MQVRRADDFETSKHLPRSGARRLKTPVSLSS